MNDKDIVTRFLEALTYLKKEKRIHGISNFTNAHAINRRNFYKLTKEPERGIFKVCWLSFLVEDYGVSADWLLTGKGDILGK